ncbi:hypothetical protein CDAR_551151 [Caerostris darwini]|uniref:Uncharacterized protein n=1 Tax=Caerostris darwini TaxID=1538125 RepID=A0AAV4VNQ1_9ARAC|nr:hypothetical protein CDAR_551151 [Caerostris darwini]
MYLRASCFLRRTPDGAALPPVIPAAGCSLHPRFGLPWSTVAGALEWRTGGRATPGTGRRPGATTTPTRSSTRSYDSI